jgi:hypothetical protein
MSAPKDKIDRVSGRPTNAKVETPPVAPPAPSTPPGLILHNILPLTCEFMLCFGKYNAEVCRSWAQPVVGLSEQGWFPEYVTMFPFTQAKRIEVVISRVVPQRPVGSLDCAPESTKNAIASADRDTNIRMLMSFLRDPWICNRAVLSNGGVFHTAQERFESRHFPTHRKEYFRHFTKFSDVRVGDVAALCEPPSPARPLSPPALHPARQICKSESEWDSLRDEDRARLIAAEQSQWQNQYAPSFGNSSRGRTDIGIPVPPPSFDERTDTDGWKQPPNASERESIEREDWK